MNGTIVFKISPDSKQVTVINTKSDDSVTFYFRHPIVLSWVVIREKNEAVMTVYTKNETHSYARKIAKHAEADAAMYSTAVDLLRRIERVVCPGVASLN